MTEDARPIFRYEQAGKNVFIHHGNTLAATLRGKPAGKFLTSVERAPAEEQQAIMARITGSYKRGNQRTARGQNRNR